MFLFNSIGPQIGTFEIIIVALVLIMLIVYPILRFTNTGISFKKMFKKLLGR